MSTKASIASHGTIVENKSPQEAHELVAELDLSALQPIFVSRTHLDTDSLDALEKQLIGAKGLLTYDINEAHIILSKAVKKARVLFDLRSKGVWAEEVTQPVQVPSLDGKLHSTWAQGRSPDAVDQLVDPIVVDDATTASESEDDPDPKANEGKKNKESRKRRNSSASRKGAASVLQSPDIIHVVRIEWFEESWKLGKLLPLDKYITLQARKSAKPQASLQTGPKKVKTTDSVETSPSQAILERAKEDLPPSTPSRYDRFGKRRFGNHSKSTIGASWEAGHGSSQSQFTHLLHETTSEMDDGYSSDLPEMPEWVRQGIKYACQRSTPRDSPNEDFIGLLKKIKVARELAHDEIGVRAYSTSIASIAAYPYRFTNPREVIALPGCDVKIANLFVEWKNTDKIKAVEDLEVDEELKILKSFYEIWGVGSTTAREFYYDRGWRDLDDIVEYGWKTLSRVQQIGVKFYDEFLDLIPRAEVEEIGRIVHRHAVQVRDDRIQSLIVGGYRRGKEASGDVDIVVSHPDEDQTLNIVTDIVSSLEEEGWITHTLILSLNSTHRDQKTLPYRTGGGGHGFDSLDKALVVWQDPEWPSKESDLRANPNAKNPNIHRRVDIIIAPWRTVGCAVVGWSGGTTFQRDIRRLVKNEKKWKFDSSGVRSRVNGEVIDLEGYLEYNGKIGTGPAKTMEEAEKRVFEGIGLVYRPPTERCTG